MGCCCRRALRHALAGLLLALLSPDGLDSECEAKLCRDPGERWRRWDHQGLLHSSTPAPSVLPL
ncbi:hypothetical protein CRUP_000868, partial [Coryphaenoides rupestris]